jgi:hypothetical protein
MAWVWWLRGGLKGAVLERVYRWTLYENDIGYLGKEKKSKVSRGRIGDGHIFRDI